MERFKRTTGLGKTFTVALVASALLVFSSGILRAQTPGQDFFTNVVQTELRTAGAGDGLPGFNPCGTGGTVATGGLSCADAVVGTPAAGDGLLSGTNVLDSTGAVDAPGLFAKLGPGAVTDNMFGLVLKPLDPTRCGADGSSISTLVSPGELNCGNVRFDPMTQGQIIPNRGDLLTSVLSSNTTVDVPPLVVGVSSLTDHTSQMQNAFVWNPLTSSVLLPTGQTCAPRDGQARVCSFQSLDDVTTLGTGGKAASVSLVSSWTTGQNELVTAGVLSSSMTNAQPAITWSSVINQAEMGGTGGDFEISTSGSFNYHAAIPGSSPILFFPLTQYPTGLSFSDGDSNTVLPKP